MGVKKGGAKMTEGKFLIYTVSAIFLLMAIHIFQPQLNSIYNPDNYVGFHILLEVLSISISAAIFFYGLKGFGETKSRRMLLWSFTFLIVGLLDLLHTITFKGMPHFFTDSSVAKATWFWVISRAIQSFLLLLIILLPDRKVRRDYHKIAILTGILAVILIGVGVITLERQLPLLMEDGKGTTSLKNGIEYFISLIQFFSLIITLYKYHIEKSAEKLAIALALVFLLLTELIFTIYQSIYDLDNFSGHVFKVLGFYFLLKSLYFPNKNKEKTLIKTSGNSVYLKQAK
jgi:hypothetical protein